MLSKLPFLNLYLPYTKIGSVYFTKPIFMFLYFPSIIVITIMKKVIAIRKTKHSFLKAAHIVAITKSITKNIFSLVLKKLFSSLSTSLLMFSTGYKAYIAISKTTKPTNENSSGIWTHLTINNIPENVRHDKAKQE